MISTIDRQPADKMVEMFIKNFPENLQIWLLFTGKVFVEHEFYVVTATTSQIIRKNEDSFSKNFPKNFQI